VPGKLNVAFGEALVEEDGAPPVIDHE